MARAAEPVWFIFRTKPQNEVASKKILKRQGFLAYTPIRQEYRFQNKFDRARRKKTLKTFPLMVGYIFIALRPHELGWFCIFQKPDTIGQPVGIAGAPIMLEHQTIRRMALQHGGGEHIAPEWQKYQRTHKEFEPGDYVTIMDGPFADRQVQVTEIEGSVAKAFVEMFGREMEVELDMLSLEAAE